MEKAERMDDLLLDDRGIQSDCSVGSDLGRT